MNRTFEREVQTVYFHGLPGSPFEISLFGSTIENRLTDFFLVDRCGPDIVPAGNCYFEYIAKRISDRFRNRPLRLIGFSLGASAALRVAPHLGSQVQSIDIVSAAAPLSLGDYLDDMAGAPVFRSALISPVLLRILVWLQSKAAIAMPGQLYAALFSSAKGKDVALASDPTFRAVMRGILQHSLVAGAAAYRREVELYTKDWTADLERVTQPVWIHHGQADNWTPVAMASDLAARLPVCAGVRLLDDMSHYSTLRAFLSAF